MQESQTTESSQLKQNSISPVRLLTYNVFLRPPGINNNGDDYKNERCELIIEELKRFDIICFQELFGLLNFRKSRVQNKAFKKGFIYQASSPSPSFLSGAIVDGGLTTMSRYPILKYQFQSFPYGVLSDNLSLKGVLYTQININGNILHLFNTHFQASYVGKDDNIRVTLLTRVDQMKCYRKFLTKMLFENRKTINDLVLLVGDFNVDALHEGYSALMFDEFSHQQLNIKNPNLLYSEYDTMIQILTQQGNDQIFNLLKVANSDHLSLPTYGDTDLSPKGSKIPAEIVLTDIQDLQSNQCLDYIMQYIQSGSNIDEIKLVIPKDSVKIEKFKVLNQMFTQLSDHYGISCKINVKLD